MATARKIDAVTETKVIEVEPEKFVLELTADEASMLRTVMARFNGLERGNVTSNVYHALGSAGVQSRGEIHTKETSGYEYRQPTTTKRVGVLYFKD